MEALLLTPNDSETPGHREGPSDVTVKHPESLWLPRLRVEPTKLARLVARGHVPDGLVELRAAQGCDSLTFEGSVSQGPVAHSELISWDE